MDTDLVSDLVALEPLTYDFSYLLLNMIFSL